MQQHYENNKFLTAREVANEFFQGKLHYQRVLKMTREGELPAVKIGRAYVYLLSELQVWTKKRFGTPAWTGKSFKWAN